MKNLNVVKSVDLQVGARVVGHCVDVDNGMLFVLTEDFDILKIDTRNSQSGAVKVDPDMDLSSFKKEKLSKNHVKLMEYIVEFGSILIALESGPVLRFGVASFSLPSTCIYHHQRSICSFKISPDQDLVALADNRNDLLLMSSDLSSVCYQQNALEQNNSLHKPVGVGWGSKETQFFGLDGRPSKEKQSKHQVELNDQETETVRLIESSEIFRESRSQQELETIVDWRGDGQLLATLTYLKDAHKHYLKVWNRNLELLYMSEQLVTVERGLLSWVPNGRYVCCAQRRDGVINDVAMFEKNGMVHERLTLPTFLRNFYIKDMAWSNDSSILAILSLEFIRSSDDLISYKPMLMLYTTQNFHYYLKYSCFLDENCDYSIRWDPISLNRLRVITQNGHYYEYDCNFEVSHSNDHSTVAVVNGNVLHLTPIELCNIPPPMSAISIELPSLIYKFVISRTDASNIMILTVDGKIISRPPRDSEEVSQGDLQVKVSQALGAAEPLSKKLNNFHISSLADATVAEVQNIVYTGHHFVGSRLIGSDSEIFVIEFSESYQSASLKTITQLKEKQISLIIPSFKDDSREIRLLFSDCSCMILDLDNPPPVPEFHNHQHIIPHSRMSYISAESLVEPEGSISLGNDLTLRLNELKVASNSCSSFGLTENYLIYTTTDNHLHFILRRDLYDLIDKSKIESWSQPIENGGTLVTVNEKQSKVVLQMPRGNLEILHPRIFVISALTSLLDASQYVQAIKLARRHRVNMNIICDYLLRSSTDKAEVNHEPLLGSFARTIAEYDPTLLNIFITELDSEDTITDRYSKLVFHLPNRARDLKRCPVSSEEKMNRVLDQIILPQEFKYIQPRILCLLKREPKDVKSALKIIHMIDDDRKDDALKFILYFVDVDQLLTEALKLYDTDIALMVANASNKDPKEYLALLDGFNEISDKLRRRLAIDLHVKDYEKALEHILELMVNSEEGFSDLGDQFLEIASSKRLYFHAIKLLDSSDLNSIGKDSQNHLMGRMWSSYGAYLLEKRYHKEAGLAYSKALDFDHSEESLRSALTCFSLVEAYDMSIACLSRANLDNSIKKSYKDKILSHTRDKKRLILYLALLGGAKIPDADVTKLIDGCNLYMIEAFSPDGDKTELLEKIRLISRRIIPESLDTFKRELNSAMDHLTRLKRLLVDFQDRKYNESNLDKYIADTLSTVDGSELSSVLSGPEQNIKGATRTSGAPSIKTRTSTKTTKSQAAKKKRVTLKVGSRHEDLALIMELKKFVSQQSVDQEYASELLAYAFQYDTFDRASDAAEAFKKVLDEALSFSKHVVDLLWPHSSSSENEFSLYRRFSDILTADEDDYENLDFLLLVKPDPPKDVRIFSLCSTHL